MDDRTLRQNKPGRGQSSAELFGSRRPHTKTSIDELFERGFPKIGFTAIEAVLPH
jgi:hypothetical protein